MGTGYIGRSEAEKRKYYRQRLRHKCVHCSNNAVGLNISCLKHILMTREYARRNIARNKAYYILTRIVTRDLNAV